MVLKMLNVLLTLGSVITAVLGSGEIRFLHNPRSISFKGHEHVRESFLPEIYSAAVGFSIEDDSSFQGIYLKDPFNLAEGIVTVDVEGVSNLESSKGHNFPLKTDVDESEVFYSLKRRVEEHNFGESSEIIRVELAEGLEGIQDYKLFKGIKKVKPQKSIYGNLKGSVAEEFLSEVALMNAITEKIGNIEPDFKPDIFWFKVSGLHTVSDVHGENSTATKEAKQILREAVENLNNAFVNAYNGRVLVSVISSDASHTRRARNAEEKAEENSNARNLALNYSPEYPAIFNIILWLGVSMFFALLAICIFIGTMDPGRDSIIYRMTSNRIKKDN